MIDWVKVQGKLGIKQDGVAGPVTYAALFTAAGAKPDVASALGAAAVKLFPQYEITTALQLAHFLAQGAHETGGFRIFVEIWGPTPAQRRYEGRADLGNTEPGDGARMKGRGIFMLTGRANYEFYGLADTPEKAAEPETSLMIACDYWKRRKIGPLADADNVEGVTRKINGGLNGLADRTARLVKMKGLLL